MSSRMDYDLRYAVKNDEYDKVASLLATTHTPKIINELLLDASNNGYVELVKLLLAYGAHANFRNSVVLRKVVYTHSYELVELLLKYGARADTNNGYHALLLALQKANDDIFELLLDNFADIRNHDNEILCLAVQHNRFNIVELLLTKYVLRNDVDMERFRHDITKLIHEANAKGYIKILRLLVDFEQAQTWPTTIIIIPQDFRNIIALVKYACYGFVKWSYVYQNTTDRLPSRVGIIPITTLDEFVHRNFMGTNKSFPEYLQTIPDNFFDSQQDLHDYFMQHNPQLSRTDNAICLMYFYNGDQVVNSYLRHNFQIDPTITNPNNIKPQELYRGLMDIFSKVKPLDADVRVFRKVSGYDNFTQNTIKIGNVYTELGFISTSVMYSQYYISNSETIVITFIIPKGTRVIFLSELFGNSEFDDEYEILLAPGLQYEVIDIIQPYAYTIFAKIIGS